MKLVCGIYRITSTANGEIYIGKSKNMEMRWRHHQTLLCARKHPNKQLGKAYRMLGLEGLKFEILVECPQEQLDEMEQRYIAKLNPEMNRSIPRRCLEFGMTHEQRKSHIAGISPERLFCPCGRIKKPENKFCARCGRAHIRKMWDDGYLVKIDPFNHGRGSDAQEDISETKYGPDDTRLRVFA